MPKSVHSASEEKNKPVLIVDKQGVLGSIIAEKISEDLLVILVGGEKNLSPNIIQAPYTKKFPVIPDNTYSYIIIFDDNDPGIQKSIPTFIKKSSKDAAVFIYIASLSESSQKLSLRIIDSYKNTKAVLFGDIFGKGKASVFKNPVNILIKQISKDGKIRLTGDGLTHVRPVSIADLTTGILKAIFIEEKSKIFFVFPKNPLTLISLAHIFQRRNPSLLVDFVKAKSKEETPISVEGEYLLGDYDFLEKLKEEEEEDKEEMQENTQPEVKEDIKRKARFPKAVYFILLFIFVISLPILSTIFLLGLSYFQINAVKKTFDEGKISEAASGIKRADAFINASYLNAQVLKKITGAVGLGKNLNEVYDKAEDYKMLSRSASEFLKSYQAANNVIEGRTKDSLGDLLIAESSFKHSSNLLGQALLRKNIDESITKKIEDYSQLIDFPRGVRDLLFSLINPNGKRTYLVLFQNNMELRPGGGFIGSYGLLSFDKGKFIDFSIHDVYDADGQLKGHVEPPYPIRRYLPSAHLYLRDSNFNPDFTKSASSAALLLNLETGQKVDGVIGVDVSFVKELIGALGEVYVPEYKERVDKNNFFHVTESHVEKNFFPSSTQKKDFLNAMFTSIKASLSERKNLPILAIAKAVSKSISEKHIVFAFSDIKTQSTFLSHGWSGSLVDKRSSESFNDILGISEANFGVNKANYFVGRSLRYTATLGEDGSVDSTAQLSINNDSKEWPGGDYKTYVRLISPQGTTLESVFIDGKEQKIIQAVTDSTIYEARNFRPPDGLEIEAYTEDEKSIFGLLTVVPAGKSKTIMVNYSLSEKLAFDNSKSTYSLAVFKQQGTESFPFDFVFSYPESITVSSKHGDIKKEKGKAVVSKTLTGDEVVEIELIKD